MFMNTMALLLFNTNLSNLPCLIDLPIAPGFLLQSAKKKETVSWCRIL